MKIFSPAGVIFPEIEPAGTPPPPIIFGLGTLMDNPSFKDFVRFVKTMQADSLTKAMYESFIQLIVDSAGTLDPTKTLNQIILEKYRSIEASGDVSKLYQFHLYLYISLYFFAAWHCKEYGEPQGAATILKSDIRDYVQAELGSRYYSGGISIDPGFFGESKFRDAFAIDGWLSDMVGPNRLGGLKEKDSAGVFKYLVGPSGQREPIADAVATRARTEIVRDFRRTINKLIDTDIKKFLVSLAAGGSATGDLLLHGYGQFRQFAVGNGSDTIAMFGVKDYGLLFFDYELVDIDDPLNLSKTKIAEVPLLDRRDAPDTSICFLYYGLNVPYAAEEAPKIVFHRYGDAVDLPKDTGNYLLKARTPATHRLDGMHDSGEAIQLSSFAPPPNVLTCDLESSSGSEHEEMIYIVFKNKILDPRRSSVLNPLALTCKWKLPDNEFRKTSADIQTEVFAGQAQNLASLVTALAADQSFEVYASIEGLGIGRKLDAPRPGTGGLELERDADQTDRPPGAGYSDLRYAHGRLQWYPAAVGSGGWLVFYVTGFVSPLRCTWEGSLQPAQELEDNIKPYVTRDASHQPSYNCVLSSFRAFVLFEAMIERIFEAFNSSSVDTATYDRISATLNTYLDNEARVNVLLPTNRLMSKKVMVSGQSVDQVIWLNRAFIDQFH